MDPMTKQVFMMGGLILFLIIAAAIASNTWLS